MPRRTKSSGGLLREVERYLAEPTTLYWPGGGGGGGSRRRRGGSPVVRPHHRTSARCTRCGQFHTQAEHARHARGAQGARGKRGSGRGKKRGGGAAKSRSDAGRKAAPARPKPAPKSTLEVVLDAIARVPERDRLGRSVPISRVYKRVGKKIRMSLEEFKRWLLTQNRTGKLVLHRLDLVELFPEEEVEASLIDHLGATFHMIVDPSYTGLAG